jgi:hypothetical protein
MSRPFSQLVRRSRNSGSVGFPTRSPAYQLTHFLLALTFACRDSSHTVPGGSDSAYAGMQERGKVAMGVDQYTSLHRFDDLPDGGRIELQRDSADTTGVQMIRQHLQSIAQAFAQGNFSVPGFVHSTQVPGTEIMRGKHGVINYRFDPLPGGGEVRITSHDSAAVAAVHQFLAFQRQEHHAGGMVEQHSPPQ